MTLYSDYLYNLAQVVQDFPHMRHLLRFLNADCSRRQIIKSKIVRPRHSEVSSDEENLDPLQWKADCLSVLEHITQMTDAEPFRFAFLAQCDITDILRSDFVLFVSPRREMMTFLVSE